MRSGNAFRAVVPGECFELSVTPGAGHPIRGEDNEQHCSVLQRIFDLGGELGAVRNTLRVTPHFRTLGPEVSKFIAERLVQKGDKTFPVRFVRWWKVIIARV